MRALLTLPTPGRDLTLDQVRDALKETTWLPRTSNQDTQVWAEQRIAALIEKFPPEVREQLIGAEKAYIQVGFAVQGLVSLEREQTVIVRLLATGEHSDAIKDAVAQVAKRLPLAFQATTEMGALALDDEIVVRQDNDGETVAKGKILTPHTAPYRQYVTEERPREWRVLKWLGWLLGISLVVELSAAVVVGLHVLQSTWWLEEIHGYVGRLSSAFVVAILTTLINLRFEYRDWRSEETEVQWLFG